MKGNLRVLWCLVLFWYFIFYTSIYEIRVCNIIIDCLPLFYKWSLINMPTSLMVFNIISFLCDVMLLCALAFFWVFYWWLLSLFSFCKYVLRVSCFTLCYLHYIFSLCGWLAMIVLLCFLISIFVCGGFFYHL